jgi:hypothetical protein
MDKNKKLSIIKNLKDYALTPKQRVFAGFLKENITSYSCCEQIKNPEYLREYFAPENDFVIYATGVADPNLLIRKAV